VHLLREPAVQVAEEFRAWGVVRDGPRRAARNSIAVRICAASKSSGANGLGR